MSGMGMIMARLPKRIIDLSGSVVSVGCLASAFALFYVAFQIPIGVLSDRYGLKRFLVGGYLLCALVGLLYYFSASVNTIFLGRMLQGIGEVPIWALAPALLTMQAPRRKGKILGMYNASLHCGLTAASLLGITVCGAWSDDAAFLLFSAAGFAAGGLIALFVHVSHHQADAKKEILDGRYLRAFVMHPTYQWVLIGVSLYGAGYGIFITLIPAFLISVKNGNQTTVGGFFALFYLALGFSQLIAGPISDRVGRKAVVISGLMTTSVGLAGCPFFGQPWLIGLLTLSAVGLGTFCVAAMAFLNDSAPVSAKGTISAMFCSFWGAGYFFGPLLMGRMVGELDFETGFMSLAGLFGLESIVLSIVFGKTMDCREPSL